MRKRITAPRTTHSKRREDVRREGEREREGSDWCSSSVLSIPPKTNEYGRLSDGGSAGTGDTFPDGLDRRRSSTASRIKSNVTRFFRGSQGTTHRTTPPGDNRAAPDTSSVARLHRTLLHWLGCAGQLLPGLTALCVADDERGVTGVINLYAT